MLKHFDKLLQLFFKHKTRHADQIQHLGVHVNKNEFELKKLMLKSESFGSVMNLLQHVVTVTAAVWSVQIIFDGLDQIAKSNPEAIGALAHVIEKLQISAILGYVVAGLTTIGFVYERRGKKRAIRKLDDMRTKLEMNDRHKGSSHLDENGHTPK
jgi:hypothetical protein